MWHGITLAFLWGRLFYYLVGKTLNKEEIEIEKKRKKNGNSQKGFQWHFLMMKRASEIPVCFLF